MGFVIAASWLSGSLSDYQPIARELQRFLSADEMPAISRIVILPPGKMAWMSFQGGTRTPSALGLMRDFVFNGERVAEGYVIASVAARLAAKAPHRQEKRRRAVKSVHRPAGRTRSLERERHEAPA